MRPDKRRLFVGIDCGTGGVRTIAAAEDGEVVAQCSVAMPESTSDVPEGWHEQSPEAWWKCLCQSTAGAMRMLIESSFEAGSLAGVAVDGTSGTLVCLDADGQALRPAIMYNDVRSAAEADEVNGLAGSFCEKLGYRFAASFAVPKMLWVKKHEPDVFAMTAHFAHHADYAVLRLTDRPPVSDYSNALKTGYDLVDERWPEWLEGLPGMLERLPGVVAPGTMVGHVSPGAALTTALPERLPVVAGVSDGTAGCIASGLHRPGDFNTTLGTTLVFKGLSRRMCKHPGGIVYSHKLPGGIWLPGAASNTGADWTGAVFPGCDAGSMDASARERLPVDNVAYPLMRAGERFPFDSPGACGFCVPGTDDESVRYAAYLQGTAFVERMGYDVLEDISGERDGEVYGTGGGSTSDVWMQIRADVTGRVVHRPACPESAFGSAVLAAAGTDLGSLAQATSAMVRVERSFAPDSARRDRYDELYATFCGEIDGRGYR